MAALIAETVALSDATCIIWSRFILAWWINTSLTSDGKSDKAAVRTICFFISAELRTSRRISGRLETLLRQIDVWRIVRFIQSYIKKRAKSLRRFGARTHTQLQKWRLPNFTNPAWLPVSLSLMLSSLSRLPGSTRKAVWKFRSKRRSERSRFWTSLQSLCRMWLQRKSVRPGPWRAELVRSRHTVATTAKSTQPDIFLDYTRWIRFFRWW